MTSFYPSIPQSFDALKANIPAQLVHLGCADRGVPYEQFWLGVKGKDGRALAVSRDEVHGVELTRHGNSDPNDVLQALADHWGCSVVSEYENEHFEPGGERGAPPHVFKTEAGEWRCGDCSMYGGRESYSTTWCGDMLEHLQRHQQLGERPPEAEVNALLHEFWVARR